jgi:2-polyprenyl-6-methoxyphenol hydroxylase-like FAD-dependent oxidoreductase
MKTALVVGGGATGKALALALARGADWKPVLFDPKGDDAGFSDGALMLWSNAVMALHRIGIRAETLLETKEAVVQQRMDFRTFEGDLLWSMPINSYSDRAGFPSILIDRRALQEVLLEACKKQGRIERKTARFWDYRDDGRRVEATFLGGKRWTGDVLLGADSAKSDVAKQLLGPPRFRSAGQYVAFGYSTHRSLLAPPGACYCLMDADHRFFAAGAWKRSGSGRRLTYWGASVPRSLADKPEAVKKETLQKAFRQAAPEVHELLEHTPSDKRWVLESRDRKPGERWTGGRVGLLGDAAHPMTYDLGQGQAMGFEDAVVLAGHLTRTTGVADALQRFEADRRRRVSIITELSYRAAQVSTPGSDLLAWMRDFATANLYAPMNEQTMRFILEADLGAVTPGTT